MDDPATPAAEIARAFRFIRWVNRRLQGSEGLLAHLRRWRSRLAPRASLLDVGTGCADIPLAAMAWSRAAGVDLRITGVDNLAASVSEARGRTASEPGIRIVEADAFSLLDRFGPASFSVVHAGMMLHHLPDDQVVALLSAMRRLARVGVVWNDLSRSPLHRAGVRLLSLPLRATLRHDAVLSVDKGFLPQEVAAMAERAGLPAPDLLQWRLAGRFSAGFMVGAQ